MESKIDISIVIPVYNLESYISECLESVLNQKLSNIEVIVIDDGSVDNSLEILRKYEKKDNRIRVISQRNSGVSKSRNEGILIARGKYITFVDGDDTIHESMLDNMLKVAQYNDLEILFCGMSSKKSKVIEVKYSIGDYCEYINKIIEGNVQRSASGILFKNSILKKHKIKFEENIKYGEDMVFTIESIAKFKSPVGKIEDDYYIVRERDLSASRKTVLDRYKDVELVGNKLRNIIKSENIKTKLNMTSLVNYYCEDIFIAIKHIYLSRNDIKDKKDAYKNIKCSMHFKELYKERSYLYSLKKLYLKLIIINNFDYNVISIIYKIIDLLKEED